MNPSNEQFPVESPSNPTHWALRVGRELVRPSTIVAIAGAVLHAKSIEDYFRGKKHSQQRQAPSDTSRANEL